MKPCSKCYFTTIGYLISLSAFNKQLNCTCQVSYFGLKGIILSRDIFNYYSITVEVNPEKGYSKYGSDCACSSSILLVVKFYLRFKQYMQYNL